MKVSYLILIVLFFGCAPSVSAQQAKPAPVTVRWQVGAPGMDAFVIEGHEAKLIEYQGVTVGMLVEGSGHYLEVLVFVANHTPERVFITPSTCAVLIEKPKPEMLLSLDPEQAARALERRGRWAEMLSAFAAGLATRQTAAVVRDDRGNTVGSVVVTQPDYAAQQRSRDAINAHRADNANAANYVRDVSLKANTLFSGQTMNGWVFFKNKKYTSAIVRILIPGTPSTVYEFPFEKLKAE
jgi:hypothetical protein